MPGILWTSVTNPCVAISTIPIACADSTHACAGQAASHGRHAMSRTAPSPRIARARDSQLTLDRAVFAWIPPWRLAVAPVRAAQLALLDVSVVVVAWCFPGVCRPIVVRPIPSVQLSIALVAVDIVRFSDRGLCFPGVDGPDLGVPDNHQGLLQSRSSSRARAAAFSENSFPDPSSVLSSRLARDFSPTSASPAAR